MAAEDAWTPIPQERFDAGGLYDKRKGQLGRVGALVSKFLGSRTNGRFIS